MKLILINGQVGSGKTTIAKALLRKLDNSVYFDVDSLVSVNPFIFDEKLHRLAMRNAISLIKNFSENNYDSIIVSGLIGNQQSLDEFLSHLALEASIIFVWLRASKEIREKRRIKRMRDDADKIEHHSFIDKLIPDIETIKIEKGEYIEIDTSVKSINDVVEEIIAKLLQE